MGVNSKGGLANRLRGRLALMEETGSVNREMSVVNLATRHGTKVARLVAGGNRDAIELVALLEERDGYRDTARPSLDVLAEYEEHIAQRRQRLGLAAIAEAALVGLELTKLLQLAAGAGFSSQQHFRRSLCEGLLLNINTLASRALAIPTGEYVVWLTDAGHTMLVPTSESQQRSDVLASKPESYEILTPQLVGCWNKLERVLDERRTKSRDHKTNKTGKHGEKREPRVTKSHEGLPNLRRAREQAGLSLSDVSDRTGLAVSTIAKHELGYANPLHGSMEKIMDAIDVDPVAFHREGPVEPYAHLDSTADEFDPYNADVSHPGAGHHHDDGEHKTSADD